MEHLLSATRNLVNAENFQFPCSFILRDDKASDRIQLNFMGLNNELKALHGCDFHAWKQIEHCPALCV